MFLVVMGGLTRGIPTSYAAPPLAELISFAYENITVWPDASGEKLGYGVEPQHPSAPTAVRRDARPYAVLALIDALREDAPENDKSLVMNFLKV